MSIIIPDGGTIGSTSDTDAISIASDGNVTLSQTNPTITLGSNATFPSGHTVQTKFTQINKAVSAITDTSFQEIDSDLRIDFTPVSSSNKLVFIFHAGNAICQSSDLQVRIMFNTSSDTLPDSNFSGSATSALRQGNQEVTQVHHFAKVDSYSGTRCISPMFASSNGNSVNISNSTMTTFFMIQEVIP